MTPTKEDGPFAAGRENCAVAAQEGSRAHCNDSPTRAKPPRLPPFARALADARRRGLVPRLQGLGHLAVVLDWEEPGPAGLPRLVIPDDPAAYDLRLVAGLDVLIVHTDRETTRVLDVVDALLSAGAARVEAANREALARGEGLDAAWPRFEREVMRHAA